MRVVNSLIIFIVVFCNSFGAPYFSIRSQAVDSARQLAGWVPLINRYDTDQSYVVFALIPEFTRSFNPNKINECIFNEDIQACDNLQGLKISGSRVPNRNTQQDWLADYFGLPTDFESFVHLRPSIENVILDFSWYIGLNNWHSGTYIRFHFPFVHTRWDFAFDETIITPGIAGFDAGYFSPQAIPREQLLDTFTSFITGQQAPQFDTVEFKKLSKSKWPKKEQTKNGIAMLEAAFGWNFIQHEDYHLGLELRFGAPTGNRPKGIFLFEPILGNGNHWQVGGGITGHATLWRNECNTANLGIYSDINITHLTKATQRRTFNLCRRLNSRYILAQKINPPAENLLSSSMEGMGSEAESIGTQFKNIYTTAANLTNAKVGVSIGAQVDASFMLHFAYYSLNVDLGYNFWTKTCENISFSCTDTPLIPKDYKTWALKGDAHVFGFASETRGSITENDPIALSASQTTATVHQGNNNFIGPDPNEGGDAQEDLRPTRNPFVDNNQFAFFAQDDDAQLLDRPTTEGGEQIETSNPPRFLSTNSIDKSGARTESSSHKIFFNISHIPLNNCPWIVYFGVGGKIEFSLDDPEGRDLRGRGRFCSKCQNCFLDEWGVWLKGGFSYS